MENVLHAKTKRAELVIHWPDKTQTRHVRPLAENDSSNAKAVISPEMEDEDYRVVMGCAPYTASFNHLLGDRRPNENPRKFASLVYDRMRADAVPMNTTTYNLLMERLVCFTDGSIFDLYDQLKSEGTKEGSSVQPTRETFVLLFRACERNAEYNRAFLLYQQMRELFQLTPDTSTYNTLLGFCAAVKDVAQACYFVDEMKANGVLMDANTYNCYMSVLVDAAPCDETLSVFNRMCDDGAQPTLRTYNTLLKAMRAHGDFDKGFQAYEEMKKKGCLPDIVTYNLLLWLCEDRMDYVLGDGEFAHIRRSQEQRATGTAAVANLALTLLTEMQTVDIQPNTFSYNKVLSVLLRCEDPRFFSVYKSLQQLCADAVPGDTAPSARMKPAHRHFSLSPPRRTSNSVVVGSQASLKKPSFVSSVSISSSMPPINSGTAADGKAASASTGTPHTPSVKSILSPTATRTAAMEDVVKVLEDAMCEEDPMEEGCIRAVGPRANIKTENLVMRALLLFEQPEKCKPLHLSNRKLYNPFRLTVDLALLLFEACEKTQDRVWAETLLQEVLTQKLRVSVELFNAYLSVLSTVGDPALTDHFEQMKLGIHKLGVCVNTETFNIVMRGHLQQRQFAEGLAVFAALTDPYASHGSGLTPNDQSLMLAIQLYEQLGECENATVVIEQALAKGLPVGISVFHVLLRMLARNKDKKVETWFERLRGAEHASDSTRHARFDAECYSILMDYYLAESQFEMVAKLFTELKTSQTLEPTTAVYRVLLNMYKVQANRKAMMAAFDDARMNSVKLDLSMYNTILETFVEAKDPFVFEVLGEMRENAIPPADSTMAIFVASPAGRQQLTEAISRNLLYKPLGSNTSV